ncbi:MAG: hypothetical protein LBB86_07400 [Oscillospiraceae bacterium]|nr:hypothetical protein [Oscillospiraceae bacterium]
MNRRIAIIGLIMCLGLILPFHSISMATTPTAAFAPWEITGNLYAAAYLDGDSTPERVEVAADKGSTYLKITFGDSRVISVPVGKGESIAMIRLYSADLTGDGLSELIAFTRDPLRDTYTITIIENPVGELTLPSVPDPNEDSYKFKAQFARGHVLEITNQAYTFIQSVPVESEETLAVYREDGTAPGTLVATVAAFMDCTFAAYSGRPALELWQAITVNVQAQPLGYIVSTVVWQNGLPKLVGQRYTAKYPV